MAAARKEPVKKLSRSKIKSISLAGKTLSEEVVVERIFREARANFGVFFSIRARQPMWMCWRQVDRFVGW